MNLLNENRILWKFTKGAPEWYILSIIIYQIFNPTLTGLKTFLLMMAVGQSNFVLKHMIFKPLYKFTGIYKLPIIGIGTRPEKATNCSSLIKDLLNKKGNTKSKTFGMPSGHSQIAWTFTTFTVLQLFDKGNEMTIMEKDTDSGSSLDNAKYKILKTIYKYKYEVSALLIIYSILVSFSRVYVEGCHTIEQVTIGMIFGIIFGYLAYYIIHKYI